MIDEPDDTHAPDAQPAPAPPVPKIAAPLPPRSAQHLTEATAARHDVAQATRPPWPKYAADEPEPGYKRGKRQCIGRSTQTGARCRMQPCEGKERCKFHGGRSTGRPPSKNPKIGERNPGAGRYFESMGKLAEVYQSALKDGSLTDTREPLAALDAFTRKVLARAIDNDVPAFREQQVKLAQRARNAFDSGDLDALRVVIDELLANANAGAQADESDAVAIVALEKFGERVDAYWKTKLDRKQAINARDLVLIFQRIVDIVQAEVPGDAAVRVAKSIDALMLSTQRFDRDAFGARDAAIEGGLG